MHWSKLLGALVVLGIGIWAIGAIVSLVINPLAGESGTAAAVVLAVVGVAVLALVAVGAKGRRWVYNSKEFYW